MTESGNNDSIGGPAFVLGDDVNTDLNCSGKYLPGKDEAYIAAQAGSLSATPSTMACPYWNATPAALPAATSSCWT
jgi:hypothetical protein